MKRILLPIIFSSGIISCSLLMQTEVSAIRWSTGAMLPPAPGDSVSIGVAGPFTGIHNNVLLVGGGANFPDGMPWEGGKKKYHDELFVFRKSAGGKFQAETKSFRMPFPVAYGVSVSVAEGVISVGGETADGATDKCFLVSWDEASSEVRFSPMPDLPFPLTNAAGTVVNRALYVAGGETAGKVSSDVLKLNLDSMSAGWKAFSQLPEPVSHAVLLAQQRGTEPALFVIGGRKKNDDGISTLYDAVHRLDLHTRAWTAMASLPYAVSAATGISAGKNHLLIFSGDKGEVFHQVETVIAAMSKETDTAKKQQLDAKRIQLLSTHPGFTRNILEYDTAENIWSITDSLPYEGQVTTTALKWDDMIVIPGGEIKAGVRTPRIVTGTINPK